ncbi:MAG: alpha/beta hydrolase [Bacteroidota bacterium]
MPVYLLLIGFLTLFFLSALFVIVKVGPLIILQPHRITVEDYRRCTNIVSPADLHLPFKDIAVHSIDGVKLVGWIVPAGASLKGTIIYLHGVGDNRISGLPIAKLFHDQGYNFCLFDSRRHGGSEGRFCTYGYHEKFDVSETISALERSSSSKLGRIGVFGVSMGAAVAIQAAAIDARIVAVVAEACFTDLWTIGLDHQKRIIKVRSKFIGKIVMKRAERVAGFHADEVSPMKAVADVHVPILFVHGTQDSIINPRYSEELYRCAREPKELYFIRDAYHNDAWAVGGREYQEKILNFFDRWLSPTGSTSN